MGEKTPFATTLHFERVKGRLKRLFVDHGINMPQIRRALPTDPCDVTDPPHEVRISDQDCCPDYQARHVFGHYLADLHMIDSQADFVADTIAEILNNKRRKTNGN